MEPLDVLSAIATKYLSQCIGDELNQGVAKPTQFDAKPAQVNKSSTAKQSMIETETMSREGAEKTIRLPNEEKCNDVPFGPVIMLNGSNVRLNKKEMLKLLLEYGPEVPTKSTDIRFTSEASIKRKFRQWNPNFSKYFVLDPGHSEFVPILGKSAEIRRRKGTRDERVVGNPKRPGQWCQR